MMATKNQHQMYAEAVRVSDYDAPKKAQMVWFSFKENDNIKFEMDSSGHLVVSVRVVQMENMPQLLTHEMMDFLRDTVGNKSNEIIDAMHDALVDQVTKAQLTDMMWDVCTSHHE